jgi:hypothetical protein
MSDCRSSRAGGALYLHETERIDVNVGTVLETNVANGGGGGAVFWSFETGRMDAGINMTHLTMNLGMSVSNNTGRYGNLRDMATSAYSLRTLYFVTTNQRGNESEDQLGDSSSALVVNTSSVVLDYYDTSLDLPEQVLDMTWKIVDQSDSDRRASLSEKAVGRTTTSSSDALTKKGDEGSSVIHFPSMHVYGWPGENVTLLSSTTSTTRVDPPLTLTLRKCNSGEFVGMPPEYLCTLCPAGWHSNVINAPSCAACSAGKFSEDGPGTTLEAKCKDCDAGKYSTSGVGQTTESVCLSCRKGTYSDAGTGQSDPLVCKDCEVGTITDQDTQESCKICDKGTYGDQGHTKCVDCPSGWRSRNPVNDQCLECVVGMTSIVPGVSSCKICVAGKYADEVGDHKGCKMCVGSYILVDNSTTTSSSSGSGSTGSTGSSAHDEVSDCLRCAVGKYFIDTVSSCNECPVGKFQPVDGTYLRTDEGVSCDECPAGWSQHEKGRQGCRRCKVGKYQFDVGQEKCFDCPNGYSTANQDGSNKCTNCPAGKHANQTGLSSCFDCSSGLFANNLNQEECNVCPKGFYQVRFYA